VGDGPILITGAGGFAGSHLLDLLSRSATADVIAWHRPGSAFAPRRGVRTAAVDILDAAQVREQITLMRPTLVYHCAGAAHVARSWNQAEPTFAVNVRGTHHLFEALRLAGIGARVVIPSSAMVYRPADKPLTEDHALVPQSPYGLSKLAQELLACRAAADGIDTLIARAFNHIGPRQDPSFAAASFAQQIASIETGERSPELVVGNLDARRDLTDVRDMVRAYTLIAERGRTTRPYNVCSGRAISIRELLDTLLARARVAIAVRVDPQRYRPNDLPLLIGDPARVREEIGWAPEIPLDRTIDDLLDYWRGVQARRGVGRTHGSAPTRA
jgi:GDP-4-dehydro-6-deoxy-D-mannose reductase